MSRTRTRYSSFLLHKMEHATKPKRLQHTDPLRSVSTHRRASYSLRTQPAPGTAWHSCTLRWPQAGGEPSAQIKTDARQNHFLTPVKTAPASSRLFEVFCHSVLITRFILFQGCTICGRVIASDYWPSAARWLTSSSRCGRCESASLSSAESSRTNFKAAV